ncbi:nodulation protein NfeD [Bacteroidales bacterium MB20-C3-3]|nr:nodulation protein NfeD [Bacteroidales bacterium MB20-C3-3]
MFKVLLSVILIFLPFISSSQEKRIFVIPVKGEISKATERTLSKGLQQADEKGYDFVIVQLNTYGGAVASADSMRSALLRFPVPIAAFIDNQAVSAGALISIACDSIYMTTGSTIGAATVVNQNGEPMPDKYQSFMRAMMRSTAQANGRDPKIAEAMVDPTIVASSTGDDSLKVLSFTMEEAIENNYCEGFAEKIQDVATLLTNGDNYILEEMEISFTDEVISFLLSPVIQGLLLMVIIGGLYFELQSPGIGFPSAAAVIAALLYFAPLYLEGLAENWEILLFAAGILLIIAEIFIIPGFGIAGISGITLTILALVFAMIDNNLFYFKGNLNFIVIVKPLSIVMVSALSSLVVSIWLAGRVFPGKSFSHLALRTKLDSSKGYIGVEDINNNLIGKVGIAASCLRPAGKIEIEGKWYDATIEFGMADKGEELVVTKFEGGRVYCERLPQ